MGKTVLSFKEITELMGGPEKFFQKPEREKESYLGILIAMLPFIVLFFVGSVFISFVLSLSNQYHALMGILIIPLALFLFFLIASILFKIFGGFPFFKSYQACMYGLTSFFVLSWIHWGFALLSFFSIYWGFITLHKISRKKSFAVIVLSIVPAFLLSSVFVLVLWGSVEDAVSALGINRGNVQDGVYTNKWYGFSMKTPENAVIVQNGSYVHFYWNDSSGQRRVLFVYTDFQQSSPEDVVTGEIITCKKDPVCKLVSENSTVFAGDKAYDLVMQMEISGTAIIGKASIFCISENSRCFEVVCLLRPEEYSSGDKRCENVASTFNVSG